MHTLHIILGPTGVGKTDYALALARRVGSPVVSCDSRQVFREMRIGTARPTDAQLAEVPHYFIADRSVTEPFTAGQFELEALALLDRLFQDHETVVMAGGSGLYIDALCNGLDDFPPADPELREQLSARLREEGVAALRAELRLLDPESYAALDPANGQRIVRALEVTIATGRKFSSFKTHANKERPFAIEKTGLTRPRAELYARIDARVDAMMAEGLLDEARALLPHRALPALNTVGYKELFDYFDGKYDLAEAVRLIKRNTRHYAKKQLTWWGRDASIRWITLSE
ncbi:MAG: tRNA (adenosine(37)-N6)-dimethylallyltransferase MiaA [Bacteroidales bacterium]|jgi:tRNA dimethylallyltransferase|nr:tRNA (adenosine(37)-N6)-dimethylallyltransferase MiaA [Bacteroidales bacterium]MBQ1754693.1 tRNA (adenosine(37)-N6)-dimethylallyltransferase MiaA [Bacteroidales bacterium]MBQ1831445.1 tRNA (adenosine(37)-N6)-dimethylallyltransferase MiaA [Bacteroidales bacterium]MBQ4221364.1 tRNA (adenosine(37)-N6)-dimethylallyltransferase MiaA [Bacteroidales bacterium]MBR6868748.1 tRNA (adenosine(37)-N6)-dimethylallyltransferase MiaA [Bacteroidales bacterium]